MKKLIFASLLVSGCATYISRTPQNINPDLLEDMTALQKSLSIGDITPRNCKTYFNQQLQIITEERLQKFINPNIAQNPNAKLDKDTEQSLSNLLTADWQAYLSAHERLNELTNCRTEMRELFYRLRSIRDMIGDKIYDEKPLVGADIDFQKQPIPLKENNFYHGYLSNDGRIDTQPITFQSGDLMMTRGTSFFSAILGAIADQPGQLSHFVLVNKSAQGLEQTMEAYAQTGGVTRFDMDYALKNENARILLLRPKNSELGMKASQDMMNQIIEEEQGKRPRTRYDYQMDLTTKDKMTCSEVSYWAYRNASNGEFIIPEEKSTLDPRLKQIYKKIGMRDEPMLTPQDMEVDSRFNIVAEFTDYRLVRDSRYRQAVMQSLLSWIKNYKYWIQITTKTIAIDAIIYPLRRTKLWPSFQRLTKVQDFPADMPKGFLKTLSQLNDISDVLYKKLITEDAKFIQKNGWSMTPKQMAAALEKYREDDLESYKAGLHSDFHILLRPLEVTPEY